MLKRFFFLFLLLAATQAMAAESTTLGGACSGTQNAADWDAIFQCVSNQWKRAPIWLGSSEDTCDPSHKGLLQWTGTSFQSCSDGASWRVVGSSGNILGGSAATTNPSRSDDVTTGLFSDTATSIAVATGGTERLRVTATGSVGLGTPSPASKLDISGSVYSRRFALTDAATVAVDWNNSNIQSVTLAGNRTFTFANGQDGGRYILIIKQDATGSRTITWPATVRWPGGSAPTLTTTASKTDYIGFIYNGVDGKYDGIAMAQNL